MIVTRNEATLLCLLVTVGCVLSGQMVNFRYQGTATANDVILIEQTHAGVKSARQCSRMCCLDLECRFFLWEGGQQTCSTGNSVVTNTPSSPPVPQHGVSYVRSFHCRYELGYTLYRFRSAIMCLYLTNTKHDYAVSKQLCQDLQGRLVMVDTQDKIDLVEAYAREKLNDYSSDFRLGTGLIKDQSLGLYLWPDNTTMTQQQHQFWMPNEPSNEVPAMWIMVATYFNRLDDVAQTHQERSVCEMTD